MNQYKTEPEFILEESEKIHPMVNKLDSLGRNYMAVQADLALLYQELSISTEVLEKIRDSVQVLALSLREQE